MVDKLCVIIAIFPYGDADTVAVSSAKETAVNIWRKYMLNGEVRGTDTEEAWLEENARNLALYGKTERQDSGTFYRLNPMTT